MKEYFYLYKTTNLINGNYYIGVHSSNNPERDPYCGSGTLITRAVAKYGRENFKVEILKYFDTWEDALDGERITVNEETLKDPKCYNLVTGGRGVTTDVALMVEPEEQKIVRVAKSKVDQLLSEGFVIVRRYRLHRDGVETLCPEHLLEQYLSEGWQKGPTKEHAAKISEDHRGRQHTEETKQKIRLANTGKIMSEETRKKLSEANKGHISIHKGTIWLVRGSETLRINPADYNVEKLKSEGWIQTNRQKGRIGIEKAGKTKYVQPENLDEWLSEGWVRRAKRIPVPREQRQIYFITDGTVTKRVPEPELNDWLARGWTIGRAKKPR